MAPEVHVAQRFRRTGAAGIGGQGAGQVELVVATFERSYKCVNVAFATEIFPGAKGVLYPLSDPGCPGESIGGSSAIAWGRQGNLTVGRVKVGTTIETRVDLIGEESTIYGYRWGSATAPVTQTPATSFTVTGSTFVTAIVGPKCYDATAAATGPGTVTIRTPINCRNPAGGDGWSRDTEVNVVAKPNEYRAFLADWTGNGNPTSTRRCAACLTRELDEYEYTNTFKAGPTSEPRVLTARFDRCWSLDIEVQGLLPDMGKVDTTAPDCPIASKGRWFKNGTLLQAHAKPNYDDFYFSKWNLAVGPGKVFKEYLDLPMTEDLLLRPAFIRWGDCASITVKSGDTDEVQIHSVDAADDEICETGELSAEPSSSMVGKHRWDKPFTVNATRTSGDPLLGWTVKQSGKTYVAAGDEVTVDPHDNLVATAVPCVQISPTAILTNPLGGVSTATLSSEEMFVGVSSVPDCPYNTNGFRTGTTIAAAALANPTGYTFTGWSEPTTSTERAIELELDGSVPNVPLTANYKVTCFKLTLTHDAKDVTSEPRPNCPGYPESEGRYVGGTTVILFGRVPGGKIWQGWTGDVPAAKAKTNPVFMVMDADKTAGHRWRSKTTEEEIEGGLEWFGDQLAVLGKKVVGVMALVAVEFLTSLPPLDVLTMVGTLAMVLEIALTAAGVGSDITQYLRYIHQSISLLTAGLTCLGSWGFAAGGEEGGAHLVPSLTGQKADEYLNGAERAAEDAKAAAKLEQSRTFVNTIGKNGVETVEETTSMVVKAKMGYRSMMSAAGTAGNVAGIAMSAYSTAENGAGIGWDASAKKAWTDWGGYTDCLTDAVPDYIPLPKSSGGSTPSGGSTFGPDEVAADPKSGG